MGKNILPVRRYLVLLTISCLLVLSLILAACGTNVGAGGSRVQTLATQGVSPTPRATTTQSASPTPTATQHLTVGNAYYGCPNRMVAADLPPAANVTLRQVRKGETVNVSQGDTVEIDLGFGPAWQGPAPFAANLLATQSPSGYAVPTASECVWRFTALAPGSVTLFFTGRPICKAHMNCPMYIVAIQFTLDIVAK